MYAMFKPGGDQLVTRYAVAALLDLFFDERGFDVNAGSRSDRDTLRASWFAHLMPATTRTE